MRALPRGSMRSGLLGRLMLLRLSCFHRFAVDATVQQNAPWPHVGVDAGRSGFAFDRLGPQNGGYVSWTFRGPASAATAEVSSPVIGAGPASHPGHPGHPGIIFIGFSISSMGGMIAIDALDGRQEWVFHTTANVKSSAVIGEPPLGETAQPGLPAPGTVYFGDDDATVYAVRTSDGLQRWSTPLRSAVIFGTSIYIRSALLLSPTSVLYAGVTATTGEEHLVALNASSGTLLWYTALPNEDGYVASIARAPLLSPGNDLVYGTTWGNVAAFSTSPSAFEAPQVWNYTTNGFKSGTAFGLEEGTGYVYTAEHSAVYRVTSAAGTGETYYLGSPGAFTTATPVVADGCLFFATEDAETGPPTIWAAARTTQPRCTQWNLTLQSVGFLGPSAQMLADVNLRLFTGLADSSYVVALDGLAGREAWRLRTSSQPFTVCRGSPALTASGWLVFALTQSSQSGAFNESTGLVVVAIAPCPAGTVFNASTEMCQACPQGIFPPIDSGSCSTVPSPSPSAAATPSAGASATATGNSTSAGGGALPIPDTSTSAVVAAGASIGAILLCAALCAGGYAVYVFVPALRRRRASKERRALQLLAAQRLLSVQAAGAADGSAALVDALGCLVLDISAGGTGTGSSWTISGVSFSPMLTAGEQRGQQQLGQTAAVARAELCSSVAAEFAGFAAQATGAAGVRSAAVASHDATGAAASVAGREGLAAFESSTAPAAAVPFEADRAAIAGQLLGALTPQQLSAATSCVVSAACSSLASVTSMASAIAAATPQVDGVDGAAASAAINPAGDRGLASRSSAASDRALPLSGGPSNGKPVDISSELHRAIVTAATAALLLELGVNDDEDVLDSAASTSTCGAAASADTGLSSSGTDGRPSTPHADVAAAESRRVLREQLRLSLGALGPRSSAFLQQYGIRAAAADMLAPSEAAVPLPAVLAAASPAISTAVFSAAGVVSSGSGSAGSAAAAAAATKALTRSRLADVARAVTVVSSAMSRRRKVARSRGGSASTAAAAAGSGVYDELPVLFEEGSSDVNAETAVAVAVAAGSPSTDHRKQGAAPLPVARVMAPRVSGDQVQRVAGDLAAARRVTVVTRNGHAAVAEPVTAHGSGSGAGANSGPRSWEEERAMCMSTVQALAVLVLDAATKVAVRRVVGRLSDMGGGLVGEDEDDELASALDAAGAEAAPGNAVPNASDGSSVVCAPKEAPRTMLDSLLRDTAASESFVRTGQTAAPAADEAAAAAAAATTAAQFALGKVPLDSGDFFGIAEADEDEDEHGSNEFKESLGRADDATASSEAGGAPPASSDLPPALPGSGAVSSSTMPSAWSAAARQSAGVPRGGSQAQVKRAVPAAALMQLQALSRLSSSLSSLNPASLDSAASTAARLEQARRASAVSAIRRQAARDARADAAEAVLRALVFVCACRVNQRRPLAVTAQRLPGASSRPLHGGLAATAAEAGRGSDEKASAQAPRASGDVIAHESSEPPSGEWRERAASFRDSVRSKRTASVDSSAGGDESSARAPATPDVPSRRLRARILAGADLNDGDPGARVSAGGALSPSIAVGSGRRLSDSVELTAMHSERVRTPLAAAVLSSRASVLPRSASGPGSARTSSSSTSSTNISAGHLRKDSGSANSQQRLNRVVQIPFAGKSDTGDDCLDASGDASDATTKFFFSPLQARLKVAREQRSAAGAGAFFA